MYGAPTHQLTQPDTYYLPFEGRLGNAARLAGG